MKYPDFMIRFRSCLKISYKNLLTYKNSVHGTNMIQILTKIFFQNQLYVLNNFKHANTHINSEDR